MKTRSPKRPGRKSARVDFRPDWRRNPEKYEAEHISIDHAVLCWTPKNDTLHQHAGWACVLHIGDPRISQFACSYGADDARWKLHSTHEMIAWMFFVAAHHLVHCDRISSARARRALMRISEINAMSEWYFSL